MASPFNNSPLARIALVVGRFKDMPPEDTIAAVAVGHDALRLSYGDLVTVVHTTLDYGQRVDRIAGLHHRISGPAGTFDTICSECLLDWPCFTYRIATGEAEESEEPDA